MDEQLAANVWRPLEMPADSRIAFREDVEIFCAPTGKRWYRWRTAQEAAEMRLLHKEHSPNADRMRQAQSICPAVSAPASP